MDTAWTRRFDGPGISPDYAKALAVDDSGNVYVTGSSWNVTEEYTTIKYSPNGDMLWVRRNYFRGVPVAMGVDRNHNVYVTGTSFRIGTYYDFVTIKYSTNGDVLWVKFFSESYYGSWDEPIALAMDDSDNVYVTGFSSTSAYSTGFATIKYSPNGDTLWVRRYNGPKFRDHPKALAVDKDRNVYVTGESNSNLGDDWVTVKYSPSGDTLWVRRIGLDSTGDFPTSLAVDENGNAYVLGNRSRLDIYDDYVTIIKYGPNGDPLWVRDYSEEDVNIYATDLVIDKNSNVYVSGYKSGAGIQELIVIKYSSNGDTLWVRNHNHSSATALAVDDGGNAYMTGAAQSDFIIIKYAPNGDSLWVKTYNGPGNLGDVVIDVEVDKTGNVYITGNSSGNGTGSDIATIKYTPDGDTLWVRRYHGPRKSIDFANALAVDIDGNVYVTGGGEYVNYNVSSVDYTTFKYANNGDTLWIRRFNGKGLVISDDRPVAMKIDTSGNIYVTGNTQEDLYNYDFTTVKYKSTGDTLWIRRFTSLSRHDDQVKALTVDWGGNVIVTGKSVRGPYSFGGDFATIKYSPSGDSVWVRYYQGPAFDDDSPAALAVDEVGNVYITGASTGVGTYYDYATIKYAPNGDTMWVRRYNGPGNGNDQATALAIDDSGNVYVTGESFGSGNAREFVTIKYNSVGDSIWVRRYKGIENGDNIATDLSLDAKGNVYVTGRSIGNGTYYDYATIKYNPNGDTLWVRRYNGLGNYEDIPSALSLDSAGNAYVTGKSWGVGSSRDYATIKYNSNGDQIWVERYDGPNSGNDVSTDLAIDNSGNVFVTGTSENDYLTIKYVQYSCVAMPGDANDDGTILLSDIVSITNVLFKAKPAPNPVCRGDANADGDILLSDVIYLVNFLFKSGPIPIKNKECCL